MLPSASSLLSNEDSSLLQLVRSLQKRVQQLETRAAARTSMATAGSVNIIVGEGNPYNDEDPFTGSAMLYPAFAHSTGNYHIIGMDGGVLQFGLSADDGKFYGGSGNVVIDAEGIELANSATSWFRFEDANGNFNTITIAADPNNDFEFTNLATSPAGTISFFLKVGANTRQVFYMSPTTFVFNEAGDDIDFRVESDANPAFLQVDASAEKLFIGGRAEIRNASDVAIHILDTTGTVYFNENNGDVDFKVEGDTDGDLFWVDAGEDAVGIGGAADNAYKLSVHGNTFLDGSVVVNNAGDDVDVLINDDAGTVLLRTDASASRVGIKTSSPGSVLDVVGSFQCDSITNDTGLAAANYSPGLYNTTNVAASTLNGAQYIRLGNWVIVMGSVDIDPTAAAPTVTVLGIDLPIASNFTSAYDCSGGGSERVGIQVGNVGSDSTNDRALLTFSATDAANRTWRFWFMYEIK